MTAFSYPYSITRDTPAIAHEVNENFRALLEWITQNVQLRSDAIYEVIPQLPGPPTLPNHATTRSWVETQVIPVGAIMPYAGAVAPTGWQFCNGGIHSQGALPELYAVIGDTYATTGGATPPPVGSFRVPDLRGRVPVGAGSGLALGASGGSADAVLVSHSHGHTLAAGATGSLHVHGDTYQILTSGEHSHDETSATPGHRHDAAGRTHFVVQNAEAGTGGAALAASGPSAQAVSAAQTALAGAHSHVVGATGSAHGHTMTGSITTVGSSHVHAITGSITVAGESGTGKNLQPYSVINYIIRT